MTSRDWALALWDAGHQVVVAPLGAKRPTIPWKQFQTERVPREMVEEWFRVGEHNIALITGTVSGTVVVDADNADACSYAEAVCGFTPMVVESSKGRHYYYRHPGGKIPNAVRVVDEPPIDLRGDGGLIIGPGSLHRSGKHYCIPEGCDITSVRDLPLFDRAWFQIPDAGRDLDAPRPALIFSSPAKGSNYESAKRYMTKVPGAIALQGGDNHTYVQACRLVRGFDLSDDEALDILSLWNTTCTPPWEMPQLQAFVKHARAYGTGSFGHMLQRRAAFICHGWNP